MDQKIEEKNKKGKKMREKRDPTLEKDFIFVFQVSSPSLLLRFFSCTVHTVHLLFDPQIPS
jgi:hypothetical protein